MTKVMFRGLLAGVLLAAVAAARLRAEEAPRTPKAFAVVVGVDKYADPHIKPRAHAEADARELYAVLQSKKYLGIEPGNGYLLLGSAGQEGKKEGSGGSGNGDAERATHANMLRALHDVAAKAHKEDLVVFAYFGQGAPLGERTCYFAVDSTLKDRGKNALAAGEVEHELEKLKSQRFVAFIDVSFKGFDAGKDAAPDLNMESRFREFLRTDVKEKDDLGGDDEHGGPLTGRVLFLANEGLNPSLDLQRHGAFAEVILKGLKGAADKDGYEPDGIVTVNELGTYLNKELPEILREHGKTKEEKGQIPIAWGVRSNHFDLTHNPEVMPKVQARLAKIAALAREKKIAHEFAEEGKTLLSRMPKLKAQQELRKEYQRLADGAVAVADFVKEREEILDTTKLKRRDAVEYARKVMEGVDKLRRNYVKDLNQGELVAWAVRGLYRSVSEEKHIPDDVQDRLKKAKSLKEADLTRLLADAREGLGKREDLGNGKDVDLSLAQMTFHLDPYTTYIDPETVARFTTETSGRFTGIGVQIRQDTGSDMLRVVTPIKGSPAYKAGIKAGDLITTIVREVDNKGQPLDKPEVISTRGMTSTDAVKKITGKERTKVKLIVEREGESKPLEFVLERHVIDVETVLGVKRRPDDSWDYTLDAKNKIYYVRLTQFTRTTYRDLAEVISRLDKEGINGLVLDLRFNPGGLLDSAVKVSDLFIDDGLIVTIKPRKDVEEEQSYHGRHEGSYLKFPMAVLVNGMSASGSEIVAACLQDHRRAVVIGERSYGKGSVQHIQEFEATGGALKLTTATYWRPSGKNINKSSTIKGGEDEDWGVSPDKGYAVKLTPKDRDDLNDYHRNQEIIPRHDLPEKPPAKPDVKDRQLQKALEYLHGQIELASKAPTRKAG
jgi:C-terminal peptidase prc